ncbi:MAG: acetate--CoA ligase [Verrucomicrobiota bacterium]
MTKPTDVSLESVSQENRVFPPPPEFSAAARINSIEAYEEEYQRSLSDPEAYWAGVASELHWFKPWETVLNEQEKPFFKWFEGGKTNLAYNCIDRHLDGADRNKAALIWEGEPGDSRVLTYFDLYREVNRFANGLRSLGISKGDRIALYLPMIPELAIATLACARIGAVHTVIFAGFSAHSIRDRVLDCEARCVITADGGWRRGQILQLKSIVDEAIEGVDCVKDVVVVKRGSGDPFPCRIREGRDHWYHRLVQDQSIHCEPEQLDSEDLLFLLYTSGTTGKPKGIIHTVGGYMVYTYHTTKVVFDLRPEDVYWCSADIGWITGHSYILYGPLQNGASVVMYEGAPNSPDNGRFWDIIEKYGVTIFYTAPTAIRAFMKWGDRWPAAKDLSSLRLLGTVGEPINPEAWIWYHKLIGGERCPIVDTWWQTETGGILLSPLPGATPTKPGSATKPLFGIDPAILNEEGEEQAAGILAIRKPWPGILRGIYGDPQRFKDTYWCKWGGEFYFPGDGARVDDDGYFWILGRVDDVVNVSGHRIGTAELESVFVEHPSVAESAVIGVPHEIKGQGLVAFITVREGIAADKDLEQELINSVISAIGKFAVPEKLVFSADLPKTRSGKIMRRLLRDIAEGNALGNVTTLADPTVVETLRKRYQEG